MKSIRSLTLLVSAVVLLLQSGCAAPNSGIATRQGSVAGGVLGAIAGGIIGHQSGRGLEGAAIGGGIGALGGGVLGSAQDSRYERDYAPRRHAY